MPNAAILVRGGRGKTPKRIEAKQLHPGFAGDPQRLQGAFDRRPIIDSELEIIAEL
jgi:hypothetical protein